MNLAGFPMHLGGFFEPKPPTEGVSSRDKYRAQVALAGVLAAAFGCLDVGLGQHLFVDAAGLLAGAGIHRGLDGADERGQHGYAHDAEHDDLEVILHERHAAEEVAHQHKQAHPRDAADDVEEGELAEVHVAGTRDERGKRTEEGHESRNNDGQAAVLLEELVELGHALGREGFHLAGVQDAAAEETRDPVVGRVAQNGCRVEHEQRGHDIQAAAVGAKHARREQQAVARQERKHHDAGFDEHHQEQRAIHQARTERHDPARNDGARIVQEREYEVDESHGAFRGLSSYDAAGSPKEVSEKRPGASYCPAAAPSVLRYAPRAAQGAR